MLPVRQLPTACCSHHGRSILTFLSLSLPLPPSRCAVVACRTGYRWVSQLHTAISPRSGPFCCCPGAIPPPEGPPSQAADGRRWTCARSPLGHRPPASHPPPYTVLTPLVPGRQPANGPHGCRACLFRLAPKQGQTQTGPAAAWSVPDLDAPSHLHATPPHCPELRLHIPKVYHTPTPNAPSTQCHDPLVVCPAPSPRLRVCISLQGPIWRRPACVLRPVGKVALARSRYSAWEVVIAASACLAPGCKVLLRLHLSPSRYLVSRYISIGSMTSVVPNYSYSTFR